MFDLDAIRGLDMFKDLDNEQVAALFRIAKEQDFAAGTTIVREGAPGGMLHILLDGRVEVRKKPASGEDKPLASLGAGTVFGEMSLFDGYPYSASVVATEPVRTLSIFRNDFLQLAETEPFIAFKLTANLLVLLSHKLRKTNENLVTLAMLRDGRA
jgi:CRP/FNR family transcriptional regulator, cyclic AMP receptor protein